MSPFGSDYNRALGLYYYIKGATVDYGALYIINRAVFYICC